MFKKNTYESFGTLFLIFFRQNTFVGFFIAGLFAEIYNVFKRLGEEHCFFSKNLFSNICV